MEPIEEKSKIQSGTTLDGEFTVAVEPNGSQSSIRMTFSRAFFSHGVNYNLSFDLAQSLGVKSTETPRSPVP